jgi:hypothetical protein
VNSLAELSVLVPEAVVSRTLTVPLPAGLVAVHVVAEEQLTPLAEFAPNWIAVAPTTKFEPVIVMTVPPVVGPVEGLMDETTGGVTEASFAAEFGAAPKLGRCARTGAPSTVPRRMAPSAHASDGELTFGEPSVRANGICRLRQVSLLTFSVPIPIAFWNVPVDTF